MPSPSSSSTATTPCPLSRHGKWLANISSYFWLHALLATSQRIVAVVILLLLQLFLLLLLLLLLLFFLLLKLFFQLSRCIAIETETEKALDFHRSPKVADDDDDDVVLAKVINLRSEWRAYTWSS